MARAALQASGSSDALWLAREARAGGPMLVLAASAQDAERLREEMAWFDPALRVYRLPDWETLPYDQFSPHPDLVSERLATLWQFAGGAFDAGIVAGAVGSWFATRLLSSLLYGVSPLDPLTYGSIALLLSAVAAAASAVPARRAVSGDPVEVLRAD